MARYTVPFAGAFDPQDAGETFQVGHALAIAGEEIYAKGRDVSELSSISTPWGELDTEDRTGGQCVVTTPEAEVAAPRIMVNVAAMRLGLSPADIEGSDMPIQVIDVGREVLVVPVAGLEHVEADPGEVDLSTIPGSNATDGIIYRRTQRTPYVKIKGRLLGDGDPLACLAAAALHLVGNNGVRATYPRTRVVGELVGHPDEACEITIEAKKAGHTPDIQRVFIGGHIRPAGKD